MSDVSFATPVSICVADSSIPEGVAGSPRGRSEAAPRSASASVCTGAEDKRKSWASQTRSLLVALLLPALLFLVPAASAQTTVCGGKTGQAALQCVQDGYSPAQTLGYGPARDVMYRDIDAGPSGELESIYSGYTITLTPGEDPSKDAFSKDVNAEHVFPQSKGAGTEPRRSDIHNLYPAREQVNSARGNLPFGESPDAQTDTWYRGEATQSAVPTTEIDAYSERLGSQAWEPREAREGDVARAVLYFYAIYPGPADDAFFDQMKDRLLDWHQSDPVTQAERDRSAAIAAEQGNENPFVLDPTLAGRAFGTAASGPTLTFDPATVTAGEGSGSVTLTVRYANADAAADVDVSFQDAESTASPADIGGFSSETVSFPASAGDGATRTVAIPITEDADGEGSEEAVFALTDLSTGGDAQIGTDGTAVLTVTDNENPLVINEVLADPAPNGAGDANGDGTRSATEDEFIEIYNTSASSTVDLSGYTYDDVGVDVRHTFPPGTSVGPGESIVVFGGGTPAASIPGVVQTASSGTLALNNGGDTFRILDASGTEILSFSYDGSVDDQSLTREPDFTGSFTEHLEASGGQDRFSPGRTVDGAALPVELAGFDATWSRRVGGAQLTWSTVSETGNAGFAIERRAAGSGTETAWTQVGFEAGAGTTRDRVTYRFVDRQFPGGADAAAYRLRQIDRDGSESVSDVVRVRRPAATNLAVQGVFPNPAREQATVRLDLPDREAVTVEIYDVLGRQVWSTTDRAGPGRRDVTVPAGRLASGVYSVQVTAGEERDRARLTVVQ